MLIRPYIKNGESFQSYLYRCARVNRWTDDRLKQFLQREVAPLYSYNYEDRKKLKNWLSDISGIREVTSLTDVWFFYSELKEFFDFSRIKVCPSCYEENSRAIPAYWYLRTYLVCSKHKRLLTDICSSCGEKLTAESVIADRCLSCRIDIASFITKVAELDIYSNKAYEIFENCKTHEVFSRQLEHAYIPLQKSISILAPLTGLANEIGYEYKQRRFISIEQLHQYQLLCSELYESSEKLSEYLVKIVNNSVANEKISLSSIFLKQTKDFEDKSASFFRYALRDLVLSAKLDHDKLTAGLSWVARLFAYDEIAFIQYVEREHSSVLERKSRKNTLVIHLAKIISRFESSKDGHCPK